MSYNIYYVKYRFGIVVRDGLASIERQQSFVYSGMTIEKFFVRTILDLKEKVATDDEYLLIRAAGLLRHLLNDATTLISLANSKLNLKIKFTVNSETAPDNYLLAKWVDVGYLDGQTTLVSMDGFIKRPILTIVDMRFTVIDFIKVTSHCKGGIHSYDPKEPNEKVLSVLDEAVFKNKGLALKTIKGIAKVTIEATEPLVNAITGHTPAGGF